MTSNLPRTEISKRAPAGDLALLGAIILVGLWPFFAFFIGETPPAWELGVGTVAILMSLVAVAGGVASRPKPRAEPGGGLLGR